QYFHTDTVIKMMSLFFFFFQAEDGIRDFHVTGVQTCALPIYPARHRLAQAERLPACAGGAGRSRAARGHDHRRDGVRPARGPRRSEERRVGKEWRSRWSPDH